MGPTMKSEFIKLLYIIIIGVTLSACGIFRTYSYSGLDFHTKIDTLSGTIAVLDFQINGNDIPSKLNIQSADRFSESLFLTKEFKVIDRAQIRALQSHLEIYATDKISNEKIEEILYESKANYIILGKIEQLGGNRFTLNRSGDKLIQLSVRAVSTETKEVVSLARMECRFKDGITEKVNYMIDKVIKEFKN